MRLRRREDVGEERGIELLDWDGEEEDGWFDR